ncbi:MAG: amidohydrolase family protein [Candidatus Natronoplasma sp.]
MKRYNGPYLTKEGFIQAEFLVEENEVKEYESGGDGGEDAIIIPAFYNSHTHVGDSVVKEAPTGTIEEIVGPGGMKEESLSTSSKEEMISFISSYLKMASSLGVRYLFDFREGGMKGLEVLRRAMERVQKDIYPIMMCRPRKREYDEEELKELLSQADGMGLSAHRDWDETQIGMVAETAKKMSKPLAMHCSEDVREPLEKVLGLGVHHLVHMVEATEEDLELCAEEEVPVVICPRANMFFGKMPDIPKMLECGVTLSLGTDNAMISSPNMFREMETAYRIGMLQGEVSPEEILMMATWNPRRSLSERCVKDEKDSLLILKHREGDPAYNLVKNAAPKDVIEVVDWY